MSANGIGKVVRTFAGAAGSNLSIYGAADHFLSPDAAPRSAASYNAAVAEWNQTHGVSAKLGVSI